VLVALALLIGLASFVGLIWLAVRLLFWFVAIVLDGVGPLAGLKASFAATQGRWWKALGLMAVGLLIAIGVGLVFQIVGGIAGSASGPVGGIIGLFLGVLGLAANLYVGFALLGANISFYRSAKSAGSSSPAPSRA
jgi:hypothetical protein